jgi:hypothetical protein
MKLTQNQKTAAILIIGGGALAWWWYRRSKGLSLIPNTPFSGGGGMPGTNSNQSQTPTVGGTVRIDNPDVIKQRDAQTGALARKSCIFPNRWINTTTGPYFGRCVQGDVFQKWIALPGDVQLYATDATYVAFMKSIGR